MTVLRPGLLPLLPVGVTAVVSVAVAIAAGVGGARWIDHAPVGDHTGTLTLRPSDVRPGEELHVEVSEPDPTRILILTRWDGARFRETYAAQGSSWSKIAADGQSSYAIIANEYADPSGAYELTLSSRARPGSYRACVLGIDACADLTIEGAG